MKIFEKDYSSEELSDLSRDISECFDPMFNPLMNDIPKDDYGFDKGTFVVSVRWESEE